MNDNQSDDIDHLFKLVLIGDSEVGKSNILLRFTKNTFAPEGRSTIGVEFSAKKMVVNDIRVKVQLWDTAGQEKFRAITKAYYRGAVGAVLVYDVTKQKSFTNIEKWLSEIKEWADTPNIIVMMLGNKVDREEEREVSKDAALQFAEANKMGFVETSAKTGANIDFAFKKLIEEILRQTQQKASVLPNLLESELEPMNARKSKNVELNSRQSGEPKKNDGCC